MTTQQQRMRQANNLYQRGKYKQALRVLSTIQHPKARQAEKRVQAAMRSQPGRGVNRLIWGAVAFVGVAVIVGALLILPALQIAPDERQAQELDIACDWLAMDGIVCNGAALLEAYPDETAICLQRGERLEGYTRQIVGDCLIEYGVFE